LPYCRRQLHSRFQHNGSLTSEAGLGHLADMRSVVPGGAPSVLLPANEDNGEDRLLTFAGFRLWWETPYGRPMVPAENQTTHRIGCCFQQLMLKGGDRLAGSWLALRPRLSG